MADEDIRFLELSIFLDVQLLRYISQTTITLNNLFINLSKTEIHSLHIKRISYIYLKKKRNMSKELLKETGKVVKDALTKQNTIKYYIVNGNSILTDLANGVELSVPTTTRFVAEMFAQGYIEDFGKLETAEGRHPNLDGLKADAAYFVGVDIK